MLNRRTFNQATGASIVSLLGSSAFAQEGKKEAAANKPFTAKFAPHPGLLFGGKDKKLSYIDQLKLAYDLGFRAWEDNGLAGQKNDVIEKVAEFMKDKKMELGVCVITSGNGSLFNKLTDDQKKKIEKQLKRGIEVAKMTGQSNMTMLPGVRDAEVTREEQIKAAVPYMIHCCDIVEEHGIILAQEPLSHQLRKVDPLLRSFEDGHMLCKLVNRKSCKLLADFYHEGEIGNGEKLIENAEKVWDQVSYVQYGDSPGRKEPGTGNLDYVAVTKFLRSKDYTGIIGMEHGMRKKSQEGLDSLVAAYRKIDA